MKCRTWLFATPILFLLVSCVTTPAPSPTSVPTATGVPATPIPPTATIVPSPTPNPNMPKGATGEDINGEWIKTETENGKLVTYEWHAEPNGWFASHLLESPDDLKGGIPLVEGYQNFPKRLPMYIYAHEDVQNMPYLRHANLVSYEDSGKSLSGAVYNGLYNRRFKQSLSRVEMSEASRNGTLTVPFTTPQGKEYIWKPGPNIGYDFYAIPWDDATGPDFFETPERKQFGDVVYRWIVYTEADGTLVVKAAVQDPASLTDAELLAWILNPVGTVIEFDQLPLQEKGWNIGDWSDYVESAMMWASQPYFEIVRTP